MVTILPPEAPSAGHMLAQGLGQGIGAGLQQLAQKLQEHREQKQLGEYLNNMPKTDDPMEQLSYIMAAPASDALKASMVSSMATMEHYRQQAEIAQKKQQNKMISPEQAQTLAPFLGVSPEQLVDQPLSFGTAIGSARKDSPESIVAAIEAKEGIKSDIKRESDWYTKINDNYTQDIKAKEDIKNALKSVPATGVTAKNLFFKYLKNKKSPFANALMSEDIQAIEEASKSMLGSNLRQLVTGRPTEREFFWVESAILPDILKSPEVNNRLLHGSLKMFELKEKITTEARKIVKTEGGIKRNLSARVYDKLENELKETMNDMLENSDAKVWVKHKATGELLEVPASQAMKGVKAGEVELADRIY